LTGETETEAIILVSFYLLIPNFSLNPLMPID
jgi:hypothetical protein